MKPKIILFIPHNLLQKTCGRSHLIKNNKASRDINVRTVLNRAVGQTWACQKMRFFIEPKDECMTNVMSNNFFVSF